MISASNMQRYDQFVEAYLANGMNTRKTARALGLTYNKAQSMMASAYVKVKIGEALKRRIAMCRVKADHVLTEVVNLAYSNLQDFVSVGEDGAPVLDLSNLTRDQFAAVAEVHTVTDASGVTRTKLKLHDKPRALEMLGRYLKLFTDKVEIDGLDKLAEELKSARERVEQAHAKR